MTFYDRFYKVCYYLVRAVFGVFYPMKIIGAENIPHGAAMVCCNHSSMADPFLVALAFGKNGHVHIIAKVEIFKIPIVSQLLRKLRMISVDRGVLDGTTIKSALGYLKNNEKVIIFPEGTRVAQDDSTSAKTGAVKLAERAGVPVLPIYLPRRKPLFRKTLIVIGVPYLIEKQTPRRTPGDYELLSNALMENIKSLGPSRSMTGQEAQLGIRNS